MKRFTFMLMVLMSFSAYAEVYKWVDENGVTHYGSMKPAKMESKKLNIQTSRSAVPTAKQLPEDVQTMANSMAQGILKDNGDAESLDCSKAVSNAKYSVQNMLEVGAKNYKAGFIPKDNYMVMKKNLEQAKRQISVAECRSSKGQVKGFYTCMSNSYNHVMRCGKKYNYGG